MAEGLSGIELSISNIWNVFSMRFMNEIFFTNWNMLHLSREFLSKYLCNFPNSIEVFTFVCCQIKFPWNLTDLLNKHKLTFLASGKYYWKSHVQIQALSHAFLLWPLRNAPNSETIVQKLGIVRSISEEFISLMTTFIWLQFKCAWPILSTGKQY